MSYGRNTPVGNPPDMREMGKRCGNCEHQEVLFYDGETGGWDVLNDPVFEAEIKDFNAVVYLCSNCILKMEEVAG